MLNDLSSFFAIFYKFKLPDPLRKVTSLTNMYLSILLNAIVLYRWTTNFKSTVESKFIFNREINAEIIDCVGHKSGFVNRVYVLNQNC